MPTHLGRGVPDLAAAALLADGGVPAERLFVIPSGVRLGPGAALPGAPLPRWPRPRVLFVGRRRPRKGVDVLPRALVLVPDARLVLAGDGPARRRLERLADRLGVAQRVSFLGFVPHREVPGVPRAAGVWVGR